MSLRVVADSEHQVLEVDGDLNCVTSYDLHHAVDAALAAGRRHLDLDLTRVRALDLDGAQALRQCTAQVQAAGGELRISGISQAALVALADFERAWTP